MAKRKANASFMKPLQPDDALSAVVGSKPLPRTEIIKKLWAYIKSNDLQHSGDRRVIVADEKLKRVFDGAKQVNMMKLAGFIGKHVTK